MPILSQSRRMAVLIALAIVTAVTAGVAAVLVVLEAHRTPDWQVALRAYTKTEGLVILETSQAARPALFDPSLSQPVRGGWLWSIDELPQPPDEMWCVLVERGHWPDRAARQVLLVAYHSDRLHHMGWLVHTAEQEPFSARFLAYVGHLGCGLTLEANG